MSGDPLTYTPTKRTTYQLNERTKVLRYARANKLTNRQINERTTNKQANAQTKERKNERMNERTNENGRPDEYAHVGTNGRTNERTNKCTYEGMHVRTNVLTKERENTRMNERTNERKKVGWKNVESDLTRKKKFKPACYRKSYLFCECYNNTRLFIQSKCVCRLETVFSRAVLRCPPI